MHQMLGIHHHFPLQNNIYFIKDLHFFSLFSPNHLNLIGNYLVICKIIIFLLLHAPPPGCPMPSTVVIQQQQQQQK